jgi:proteasome lid subunit RPN8/RPN11
MATRILGSRNRRGGQAWREQRHKWVPERARGAPPPMTVWTLRRVLAELKETYQRTYYPLGTFDVQVGERMGILVGKFTEADENQWVVEVQGFRECPFRDVGLTHAVMDTQQMLAAVQQAKADHRAESLVGWYHTHPSMELFLSQPDLDTYNDLFRDAWHVALVFDPKRWDAAYFYREANGRIDGSIQPQLEFNIDAEMSLGPADSRADWALGSSTELESLGTEDPTEPTAAPAPASEAPTVVRGSRDLAPRTPEPSGRETSAPRPLERTPPEGVAAPVRMTGAHRTVSRPVDAAPEPAAGERSGARWWVWALLSAAVAAAGAAWGPDWWDRLAGGGAKSGPATSAASEPGPAPATAPKARAAAPRYAGHLFRWPEDEVSVDKLVLSESKDVERAGVFAVVRELASAAGRSRSGAVRYRARIDGSAPVSATLLPGGRYVQLQWKAGGESSEPAANVELSVLPKTGPLLRTDGPVGCERLELSFRTELSVDPSSVPVARLRQIRAVGCRLARSGPGLPGERPAQVTSIEARPRQSQIVMVLSGVHRDSGAFELVVRNAESHAELFVTKPEAASVSGPEARTKLTFPVEPADAVGSDETYLEFRLPDGRFTQDWGDVDMSF